MTDPRIRARIDRLEKQNLRLKIGIAGTLTVLVFLITVAAAPQSQFFKNLQTERLELIDAKGETRALMATDRDGTVTFAMTPNANGTRPVLLTADPDGIGTLTLGNRGKSSVKLTNAREIGCGLHITGSDGKERITIATHENFRPAVEIKDADEALRFYAGIDKDDTTRLLLRNGAGKNGFAEMSVLPDESTSLVLGKELASGKEKLTSGIRLTANHPQDGSRISITDQSGEQRILMDYDPNDTANLTFYDALGQKRLGMGVEKESSTINFTDKNGKARLTIYDDPQKGSGLLWFDETEKIIKQINEKTDAKRTI